MAEVVSDLHDQLASALLSLDPADAQYASRFVERLLADARQCGASDLHLQPSPEGLELRMRIDGVLVSVGTFPASTAANVVARLKVLAELLTYRSDVPQEGRIRTPEAGVEVRVSTFPTLHGERAVVRLFNGGVLLKQLGELGLPPEALARLRELLVETSGAILLTGPAGSGKTTTLYACLNELVDSSRGARSIVTIEDPIEVAVSGVTQSQVNAGAGFDMATGLRSMLRQDPEVIMIGEIRDRSTAQIALEASLTGQLVLSSFHAGCAAEAVGRLLDMGIEPFVLRSGLLAIIFQRLVRKLCTCAVPSRNKSDLLGLEVRQAHLAVGCPECAHTGYAGRTVLAEMLILSDGPLAQAILARADVPALEQLAVSSGMIDRWSRAVAAVEAGITSPAEVRRVLGFSRNRPAAAGF